MGTSQQGSITQGEIFAFDPLTKCLVIEEHIPQTQKKNVHIVKAACIKSWEFLGTPDVHGKLVPELPAINATKILQLEAHALQLAELSELKIGKGVTAEAQDIFDALDFTLPCYWESTTIVVGASGNEVRVREPYTPQSAFGGDDKSL